MFIKDTRRRCCRMGLKSFCKEVEGDYRDGVVEGSLKIISFGERKDSRKKSVVSSFRIEDDVVVGNTVRRFEVEKELGK